MKDIKIRLICEDPRQMERLSEKLRSWSKQWGSRKIFSVRRYKRNNGAFNDKNKYDRSFGNAPVIYYIRMKLPEIKE